MTKMISHHHHQEEDYWEENVHVETLDGDTIIQKTLLLRVYPTNFNGYDAYMDIPINSNNPATFKKVYCQKLNKCWEVIDTPKESQISGYFRGDFTSNNPPAWIFGLRLVSN